MSAGLDHSKQVVSDLGDMAVKVISLVKHFSVLSALGQIKALEGDVKDLMAQAPQALAEIKGIDASEIPELGDIAVSLVQQILGALAA